MLSMSPADLDFVRPANIAEVQACRNDYSLFGPGGKRRTANTSQCTSVLDAPSHRRLQLELRAALVSTCASAALKSDVGRMIWIAAVSNAAATATRSRAGGGCGARRWLRCCDARRRHGATRFYRRCPDRGKHVRRARRAAEIHLRRCPYPRRDDRDYTSRRRPMTILPRACGRDIGVACLADVPDGPSSAGCGRRPRCAAHAGEPANSTSTILGASIGSMRWSRTMA